MTLGTLLKNQRELRKLDALSFSTLLSLSQIELTQLEEDKATVTNDRAEYWAQLLKTSRVELVRCAIAAREQGVAVLVEDADSFANRKVTR